MVVLSIMFKNSVKSRIKKFNKFLYLIFIGYGVYAEEDENIDDIVDVEGEESSVITDEETVEDTSNASADADTTILFTKPIYNTLSTLGILIIFFISIEIIIYSIL